MSIKTCPKCSEEINGSRALKEHMSEKHGGFNSSDIPNETNGQAKEILGTSTLAELAGRAPTDDTNDSGPNNTGNNPDSSTPVAAKPKQGRPKKGGPTPEEIEQQKRRARALESIGGVICRKTAALPYRFWAKLAGDDNLKLKSEQVKELSDAYLEICRGYDANFTHPLMGVLAAMAINAEYVAERIGIPLNDEETEQHGTERN